MNCTELFFNTNDFSYIGVSSVHVCTCGKTVIIALKHTYKRCSGKAENNVEIFFFSLFLYNQAKQEKVKGCLPLNK